MAMLFLMLLFLPVQGVIAQVVSENYGNNPNSIHWVQTKTPHFKIVFPEAEADAGLRLGERAEAIYREYADRLGREPDRRITLYFKNDTTSVSDIRALNTDEEYTIWRGSRVMPRLLAGSYDLQMKLRTEIAYAFQQYIQKFPIDYYYYVFSNPAQSPWSDGLVSYLAAPEITAQDQKAAKRFGSSVDSTFYKAAAIDWNNALKGRSQIRYFKSSVRDSLQPVYTQQKSLLGLVSYFDFEPAFAAAAGIGYDVFQERWRDSSLGQPAKESSVGKEVRADYTPEEGESESADIDPYNTLFNTRWEPPFPVPYYLNPGEFGLAGYLALKEPMRTHAFDYYGTLSFANPVRKSFFYSSYVNNSFRPRLELSFNHFPSASGFFGTSRQVETTDVIALTSLWKLSAISQNKGDWYAGLSLRHLAFDYFSQATLRENHPDIFFENRKTQQTDLKGTLVWRSLQLHRHNLIHPPDGTGVRFSVTGSDKLLGSQSRYMRFSLDGYTVLPGFGSHRIYLYGTGVTDFGEPAGRDYLGFSDTGNYKLPGPDFTGSVNPGFERFVRGYTTTVLGDRFLFGTLEYRIPVWFDTSYKLLGILPPVRTSLTFFSDAGVMGGARLTENNTETHYRYSTGIEVKRVFSFGGSFKFTYELGIAQPLNRSFSPQPYFNVKAALPF